MKFKFSFILRIGQYPILRYVLLINGILENKTLEKNHTLILRNNRYKQYQVLILVLDHSY